MDMFTPPLAISGAFVFILTKLFLMTGFAWAAIGE